MASQQVSDMMRRWLKTLVEEESPSGDVDGISRVLNHIAEILRDVAPVGKTETPAGPILEVSRGEGGVLLLGHADTVWSRGILEEMPWRDEGDQVFGPGVLDMKGGLVLAMAVIQSLPSETPFHFMVTPDEEVGSYQSRLAIEQAAVRAPLVLVLESGMRDGAIKVGRAGVGDFRLRIHGIESHAGLEPDHGASAIRELARQVLWLENLEQKVLGTTLNVGVCQGGTRSNVVAGFAEAEIDVRVTARSEMKRIRVTFEAPPCFDERCRVTYAGSFNRPPMEPTPRSQVWVEQAMEIWQALTGERLVGARVGGASDGNFTASIAPTLDGMGAVGQGAHARHESVDWRYMMPRFDLIRELTIRAGR